VFSQRVFLTEKNKDSSSLSCEIESKLKPCGLSGNTYSSVYFAISTGIALPLERGILRSGSSCWSPQQERPTFSVVIDARHI